MLIWHRKITGKGRLVAFCYMRIARSSTKMGWLSTELIL